MRLCDHSHTHDELLPERDPERIADEVVGAGRTLSAAAARGTRRVVPRARRELVASSAATPTAGLGMQPLGWSVDPRDWKRPGRTRSSPRRRNRSPIPPPAPIVLLHDGGGNRSTRPSRRWSRLLPWLAEQGYTVGFPDPLTRATPRTSSSPRGTSRSTGSPRSHVSRTCPSSARPR